MVPTRRGLPRVPEMFKTALNIQYLFIICIFIRVCVIYEYSMLERERLVLIIVWECNKDKIV